MADRKKVYHRIDGETEMYGLDAAHALRFPEHWKDRPWTDEEITEAEAAERPPGGEEIAEVRTRKPKAS